MHRILSRFGLSLLLVGGSFAAAVPARAEPIYDDCVGTQNLGEHCATIDIGTGEGGYHDCVIITFVQPECIPVDVPLPIPDGFVRCNGEVKPVDLRYVCLHPI